MTISTLAALEVGEYDGWTDDDRDDDGEVTSTARGRLYKQKLRLPRKLARQGALVSKQGGPDSA